ncbi:cation diffusion facilitator family transporter [Candidatus Korarchaeum cryptofilum]|uniref:Cation diffusion facilitator family transporter n=1 Tax=Korarchaeum cryptofilum (strain OPF8) TaxID=374847 RepID=B1L4B0_KORCO|nr:cation diffusion facilitator family transporter [Candidatus Korarchaeum cryptofilum]ACB07289.1 cation diffusion facilitator family transporter [Candidatus Korarchaeum cryptofilum OPF8]
MEKLNRLLLSSFLASLLLSALKLYAGLVTNSLSIISEFLHSSLDSLTTLTTLLSVRYSMRPPDETHPYGHRKLDSLGGVLGGFFLIITMMWVVYEAFKRIISPPEIEIGILPISVMLISVAVDVERSRALRRAAKLTGSRAIESDSLHFSSDIFTSITVILSLLFIRAGLKILDPITGVLISLLFLRSAIKITKESLYDLTDRIDPKIIEEIRDVCLSKPGIISVERVRARRVGNFLFADISIRVGPEHPSDDELAEAIRERLNMDVDLIVERSVESIEDLVRGISKGVSGVLDVHAVSMSKTDGGKRVSLHAVVDPGIEAWRAHEISDELERKVREGIPGVVEAIVHVDPADLPILTHSKDEIEDMIRRKVEEMLRGTDYSLESLKVDEPWVVTIRILVPGNSDFRKVHDFTHKVELAVREIIPSANITVHFSTR